MLRSNLQFCLSDHTKQVLNTSMVIFNEYVNDEFRVFDNGKTKSEYAKDIALISILHDIGKANQSFQKLLSKSTEDKKYDNEYLKHNILSTVFGYHFISNIQDEYSKTGIHKILSPVLYHHVIDRKYEHLFDNPSSNYIDSLNFKCDSIDISNMCNFYKEMVQYCKDTHNIDLKKYSLKNTDTETLTPILHDIKWEYITMFQSINNQRIRQKLTKNIELLEQRTLVDLYRSILVASDRLVSSNHYDNKLIQSNDVDYIKNIYTQLKKSNVSEINADFSKYDSKRLSEQIKVVDNIIKNNFKKIHVIQASAGYGKTLIGLQFYLRNPQKLIWVTSRNNLARETYNSIIKELNTMSINNKIKVGLFLTGEMKATNFTNELNNCDIADIDILVTNIDNYLGFSNKNSRSHLLFNSYLNNVIFDEFHQFKDTEPLFSGFINWLYLRQLYIKDTQTLLLSATPDNVEEIIGDFNIHKIKCDIYGGETKIQLHLLKWENEKPFPLTELKSMMNNDLSNTFIILPTVKSAQELYKQYNKEKCCNLIHGKFTDEDRQMKMSKLMSSYGKSATQNKDLTIMTSICDTGIDISAQNIVEFPWSAQDTIQRVCGRVGRFNEYETIHYYILDLEPNSNGKIKHNIYNWLYKNKNDWNKNLSNNWLNYLKELMNKYTDGILTKNQFYSEYENFLQINNKPITKLYNDLYECSSNILINIKPQHTGKHTETEEKIHYICNGLTWRGDDKNVIGVIEINENDYLLVEVPVSELQHYENDDYESITKRYEFINKHRQEDGMFYFPKNKEGRYNINNLSKATISNCMKNAYKSTQPIYLVNARYTSEMGFEWITE